MEKRLFEILDEMNQNDEKNKTTTVALCNHLISADLIKAGTKVCIGAPHSAINDIMNDKVMPILLLIDKKEYERIKNLTHD